MPSIEGKLSLSIACLMIHSMIHAQSSMIPRQPHTLWGVLVMLLAGDSQDICVCVCGVGEGVLQMRIYQDTTSHTD